MSYTLRERKEVDYEDKILLPRAKRTKCDKIYPIEVVEVKGDDYLIHFVGYDKKYDEWRKKDDIIPPASPEPKKKTTVYRPFSVYDELKYNIKLALDSKRRKEPNVRIEITFDRLVYVGGLQQQGVSCGRVNGCDVFSITSYDCLDCLLGAGWWYRCLNEHLNFCYVNRETVRFHLHERLPVKEYDPEKKEVCELSGGTVLVFKFVRMDGVACEWDSIVS